MPLTGHEACCCIHSSKCFLVGCPWTGGYTLDRQGLPKGKNDPMPPELLISPLLPFVTKPTHPPPPPPSPSSLTGKMSSDDLRCVTFRLNMSMLLNQRNNSCIFLDCNPITIKNPLILLSYLLNALLAG